MVKEQRTKWWGCDRALFKYSQNSGNSGRSGGFIKNACLLLHNQTTSMGIFERDTDIYRDRDALREDYQPEELVGRDEELRAYQTALQPVINAEQPNNIFPLR